MMRTLVFIMAVGLGLSPAVSAQDLGFDLIPAAKSTKKKVDKKKTNKKPKSSSPNNSPAAIAGDPGLDLGSLDIKPTAKPPSMDSNHALVSPPLVTIDKVKVPVADLGLDLSQVPKSSAEQLKDAEMKVKALEAKVNTKEADVKALEGKLASAQAIIGLAHRAIETEKKREDPQKPDTSGFKVNLDLSADFVSAIGYYSGGTIGPRVEVYRGNFGGGASISWGRVNLTKFNFSEMHSIVRFEFGGLYRFTDRWTFGLGVEYAIVENPHTEQSNIKRLGVGPNVTWQPWSHFAVRIGLPVGAHTTIPTDLSEETPFGWNVAGDARF